MKFTNLALSAVLGATILLSACQPTQNNAAANEEQATASLTETYWKLTQLNGTRVEMTADQEREKNVVFNNEDNRVNGFAGCNQFFGQFTVTTTTETQGTLALTNFGSTKMACPDNDFNEQDYLTALANTTQYIIKGENLVLLDQNRSEVASFESVYLQ